MRLRRKVTQRMAEAAGWFVACLVAVVAFLLDQLRRTKARANLPPKSTKVEAEIEAIANEAQSDLDALWDDFQGEDATAAIAAAANTARDRR